jgi:hypothetical protein
MGNFARSAIISALKNINPPRSKEKGVNGYSDKAREQRTPKVLSLLAPC